MADELTMPRLSDSMEEATIIQWLKQPGDSFTRGDALVEIETDKANVVFEAEEEGVIERILVGDGEKALLGAPIALLRGDGAPPPSSAPGAPSEKPEAPAAPVLAESGGPARMDFRGAIRQGLDEALAADERVLLFGEDVAVAGGVFAVTTGLHDKYGEQRVFDTPISELALAGAAFGSAISGLRPVVEIMFGDFLALVMDSLVNQATKYWFLTQEQVSVPLVIRSVVGAGGRFGAIHSQMPVSWFMGLTGIKIVCPSFPGDARALIRAAIDDDNPVLFFEHKRLYSLEGDLGDEHVPIGKAAVVRPGRDVTIVSAMKSLHDSLAAAELLAASGIEAEVVDLRTLRPLDLETILGSLRRTNRLVVVEEGPLTGGWAGEVLALAIEHGLSDIDDAWRIATPNGPIPYSPPLEDAFLPSPQRIADEILARLR